MTKHNALPTTTDIEKAQSLDHHLLSTKQIKKTDQRGAHWKLKRNTLQAPKPGRWTFFWSKEETSIKLILQEYMRNHASILPFLQTFPWDLPECPDITIKHQRKAIWMHLYLYHLKGIIHIEFKPEFYCQILLETSMSGTLPFAFQPTITPKTYLNSFFGIYAFNVINLNAFNDNDLFPMPSGYFDTSKHFQITHERAYNRTFCRKAVVHTWHAMGFKETSPSRMEYDAFFSKRIKAQQQKEFAKRTASKALLALSKDPTKQPKLTNSPPSIKNKINIPYSPLILTGLFFIFYFHTN